MPGGGPPAATASGRPGSASADTPTAGNPLPNPPAGIGPADTLDRLRVHGEYAEGNFETVVRLLEGFRAAHAEYRKADSVVVAKYLGVVYSAHPDTREKGKYWLYRMLQSDPSQTLAELYVSEKVQDAFDRVRQEFIVRRSYMGINDAGLNRSLATGYPPPRDTVVRKDTVVVQEGYLAPIVTPIAEGIKGGYDEVKGGIKAGIEAGYVPIREEDGSGDGGFTGNLNVGAGLKFLAEEWKEAAGFADATGMRLAADGRMRKWPINIAVDAAFAFAPDLHRAPPESAGGLADSVLARQTVRTWELGAGVRKIFDFRLYSVRPFFGGGLGYVFTEWTFASEGSRERDAAGFPGIWLNGGVYWELERHFNVGIDWMYSWANLTLYDRSLNHGGHHLNMILGFHY